MFFSTIMSVFSCITRIYLYDKLHENEHLRQTSDTHRDFMRLIHFMKIRWLKIR